MLPIAIVAKTLYYYYHLWILPCPHSSLLKNILRFPCIFAISPQIFNIIRVWELWSLIPNLFLVTFPLWLIWRYCFRLLVFDISNVSVYALWRWRNEGGPVIYFSPGQPAWSIGRNIGSDSSLLFRCSISSSFFNDWNCIGSESLGVSRFGLTARWQKRVSFMHLFPQQLIMALWIFAFQIW